MKVLPLILLALPLLSQSRIAPEQIRVPTTVRVMVIANGSVQFAALDGVTLDTTVSPPVLRASAVPARIREVFLAGTTGRTQFTLASAPAAGSLVEVFVNGLLQDPADYTVAAATITLRFGVQADDKVTVIR